MTDEWAEYSITTPVFTENVSPACITFHIGYTAGTFWMDCIRFYQGRLRRTGPWSMTVRIG